MEIDLIKNQVDRKLVDMISVYFYHEKQKD